MQIDGMLLLNQLVASACIACVFAIVTDYMGFLSHVGKPFNCSMCMTFWTSIAYFLLYTYTESIDFSMLDIILSVLIMLVCAACAPLIGRLITYSLEIVKYKIDNIFLD